MKQFAAISCLAFALIGNAIAAETANPQEQQMLAVIKEIQAQQTAIAANHAKIEERLANIAEAVRVARIYSSRAGH